MKDSLPCSLCGLLVVEKGHTSTGSTKEVFCCLGCQMVYTMLMESEQNKDASDFKQTDLYKKCVAAGIISESAAAERSHTDQAEPPQPSFSFHSSDSAGYLSWSFSINNMWCPACSWVVEDALKRSKGVVNATCIFSSDRGRVLYDPVKTNPDKIQQTIEHLGYGVANLEKTQKQSVKALLRLFITLLLTMNIMMFSWSIYTGFFWELAADSIRLLSWPVLFMATIVLLYGGYPIHRRALTGIRSGTPGMEVLISSGSVSAYLFSLIQVFEGGLHLYFDTSAMLVLLILIGKMLEQSAKNRITSGLADFFSLAPEKVRLCTTEFPKGRYVSLSQLSKHDLFQAEQGEILAADGVIVEGEAMIDESSITGEARPIHVTVNGMVKSGSQILSGLIRVEALEVGDTSVFGKMVAVMENSLSEKTRQVTRFEALLKFFVPTVMGLALLTFFYSLLNGLTPYEAMNRGLSVLVISCPCALGIAIPLALTAGVSMAGKAGILVRNFEAFEKTAGLNHIVFDKTGTLTTGKMSLLEVQTEGEHRRENVLQLACALEAESSHFIATAIKQYCAEFDLAPLPVLKIVHHTNGIVGEFAGKRFSLGSRDFVKDKQAMRSPPTETHGNHHQVISEIYLAENERVIASFKIGDSVRDGMKHLISSLQGDGLSTHLISGDSDGVTCKVGLETGIQRKSCRGRLLPDDKAKYIKKLRGPKHKVAMVGDGVNDAAAMAESDLAVAVHSGLNPGEGVAAITLMQEDPLQLQDFILLATKVNRTVKQNLIFALCYNLIGIPIAAAGMLNPIIAVTAMLCSSLSVTINTLILVKKEMVGRENLRA